MNNQPESVWIQVYLPNGAKASLTFGFQDGELPEAADLQARIERKGYLFAPQGAEPGEEIEKITHVMRRNQHNKKDDTWTPCIALFHENAKLVYAYDKVYLNTPQDVEALESALNIKINHMKAFPGAFPKRDDMNAREYLVELPEPVQVRFRMKPYEKDDGTTGETAEFAGWLGISSTPQPTASGKPENVDTPDFTPNQADGAIKEAQRQQAEKSDIEWTKKVKQLTEFMYYDDRGYNEFEHTASIQKRKNDTGALGINSGMTPEYAATMALVYRVSSNDHLGIGTPDFPNALNGKSLKDYMAGFETTAEGLNAAWKAFIAYAQAKAKQAS